MNNKSKKLPIILIATGCVAGGVLGYSYNKITSTTEYAFVKTGKTVYTQTKNVLSQNKTFTDALDILEEEYKIGLDSNFENIDLALSYDTAIETYDLSLSLFGLETGYSFDSIPFTASAKNSKLNEGQKEQINALKNSYSQQLVTLFLNSETSNLKYIGEEDFDREIIFTMKAADLNAIYTSYMEQMETILTEDLINDFVVSTEDGLNFNLKDGLIGSLVKNQINDAIEEKTEELLLSSDLIITLDTKRGNVAKVTLNKGDTIISFNFNPKDYYNSEIITNISYGNNSNTTVTIKPTFNNELWALDISGYTDKDPKEIYEVIYKWDLLSTTNNFTVNTNTKDGVKTEVYTIVGNFEEGITIESENFDFSLEKSAL